MSPQPHWLQGFGDKWGVESKGRKTDTKKKKSIHADKGKQDNVPGNKTPRETQTLAQPKSVTGPEESGPPFVGEGGNWENGGRGCSTESFCGE